MGGHWFDKLRAGPTKPLEPGPPNGPHHITKPGHPGRPGPSMFSTKTFGNSCELLGVFSHITFVKTLEVNF
jgi:hypothetical protein